MAEADDQRPQWTWRFWTAVGIVLAFTVLVVVMFLNSGGDEIVWQRRVYLFGAVEALTFTAVGWIFGREVGRGAVTAARQNAAAAQDDADAARSEARAKTEEAAAADRRAVEERIKGEAVVAAVRSFTEPVAPDGLSDVTVRPGGPAALRDLRAFVDDLYG
ncbi:MULTISPECIES: hypothetical protein [Amycolatopsis]|uniref:Uncharacterized protein n=2 Tax=Amycolatopsis TaxID=1813 RepID=A0A1I3ZAC3_9PSEU|nr:hypothetical protein [Amycolatopsis sacchari]SFK40963.1 hypothetical protein SAMN05421835_12091 [Amycolatopsis sacchari]